MHALRLTVRASTTQHANNCTCVHVLAISFVYLVEGHKKTAKAFAYELCISYVQRCRYHTLCADGVLEILVCIKGSTRMYKVAQSAATLFFLC